MASLDDLIDSVTKLQATTTAAQDLADSLLFAFKHARADDDAIPSTPVRHRVIMKGRQVGKTSMMQAMAVSKFDPVHAQRITFKDLRDAYNAAMKSNPNPYLGTPPFTTQGGHVVQQHPTPSKLAQAIDRDMLPDCVIAVDGAKDDLVNWVFEGFMNGTTKTVGSVRAYQVSTGEVHRESFTISRDVLDQAIYHGRNHMDYFLRVIEAALIGCVSSIVTKSLPPHDINACTDPECPC